jgi:hypothetical protein
MVIVKPMDHDDDVEHLFSWLQTPELRYREFAGAREITDTVIIRQERPIDEEPVPVPRHNTQLEEEYPPDQFPDQRDAPADVVVGHVAGEVRTPLGPAAVSPTPTATVVPPPAAYNAGFFALGAGRRGTPRQPHYEEPVAAQSITQPTPRVPTEAPTFAPSVSASPGAEPAAPNRSGLLGGTYRQGGVNGDTAADGPMTDNRQRGEGSLDAVFGRLSEARNRLPDPRDRMRHIQGLNPPANRQR